MSAALLAGAFGGLAFDLYQKLCYGGGKRRLHAFAYLKGDALFALFLICAWLVFWFSCTDGSLRLLVFIWFGVGLAIYFGIFSKRLGHAFDRLKSLLPKFRINAAKKKNKNPSGKLVEDGARISLRLYKKTGSFFQRFKNILNKKTGAIKQKTKSILGKLFVRRKKKEEKEL